MFQIEAPAFSNLLREKKVEYLSTHISALQGTGRTIYIQAGNVVGTAPLNL